MRLICRVAKRTSQFVGYTEEREDMKNVKTLQTKPGHYNKAGLYILISGC